MVTLTDEVGRKQKGVSIGHTDAQLGSTGVNDELDPVGAEVYAWDPYPEDPDYSGRGEGGPVYPGYGNVTQPSTGCMLDGVPTPCDWIDRLYNSEGTEYRYMVVQKDTKAGTGSIITTFTVPRVYQGLGLILTADAVRERRDEEGTYWDPRLLVEVVPQNPNPPYIQDHKDKLCSLRVDFTGQGYMQDNGPTERGLSGSPGLGFTVSGNVAGGGIGKIQMQNNPITGAAKVDTVNPNGSWTVQQWVWVSQTAIRGPNHAVEYWIEKTQPDGVSEWFRRVEGNNIVYADSPGPRKENTNGILVSANTQFEFDIKLINGSQQCEVRFRVNLSYQNGKTSARWWDSRP